MSDQDLLTELDLDECLELIGAEGVGRLAVDDDEGPVILPANYVFHGGIVHIRTGAGTKLVAADRRAPAAFEVDSITADGGWSVLLRGHLKRLTSPEGPGNPDEPRPAAAGDRFQLIGLVPTRITGRRVQPSGGPSVQGVDPDEFGNVWHDRDGSDLLG